MTEFAKFSKITFLLTFATLPKLGNRQFFLQFEHFVSIFALFTLSELPSISLLIITE